MNRKILIIKEEQDPKDFISMASQAGIGEIVKGIPPKLIDTIDPDSLPIIYEEIIPDDIPVDNPVERLESLINTNTQTITQIGLLLGQINASLTSLDNRLKAIEKRPVTPA